jgi:hypothetical protein
VSTIELSSAERQWAQRVRQATVGCTIHPHGPLNALATVLEAHQASELDAYLVLEEVITQCRRRLESLPPLGIDARREQKVLLVIETLAQGIA